MWHQLTRENWPKRLAYAETPVEVTRGDIAQLLRAMQRGVLLDDGVLDFGQNGDRDSRGGHSSQEQAEEDVDWRVFEVQHR